MTIDVNFLQEQLKMFTSQRDQANNIFHQAQGAISAIEEQIRILKKYEPDKNTQNGECIRTDNS
jgi:hypothetical protein